MLVFVSVCPVWDLLILKNHLSGTYCSSWCLLTRGPGAAAEFSAGAQEPVQSRSQHEGRGVRPGGDERKGASRGVRGPRQSQESLGLPEAPRWPSPLGCPSVRVQRGDCRRSLRAINGVREPSVCVPDLVRKKEGGESERPPGRRSTQRPHVHVLPGAFRVSGLVSPPPDTPAQVVSAQKAPNA